MKMLTVFVFLASGIFSLNAFADKVTISGEPVVIENQSGTYIVPGTVKTGSDYYYFTVNDTKQVCYQEVQPSLAKVDLGVMAFKMGNDTVSLHCYTYSPDYFVISP